MSQAQLHPPWEIQRNGFTLSFLISSDTSSLNLWMQTSASLKALTPSSLKVKLTRAMPAFVPLCRHTAGLLKLESSPFVIVHESRVVGGKTGVSIDVNVECYPL